MSFELIIKSRQSSKDFKDAIFMGVYLNSKKKKNPNARWGAIIYFDKSILARIGVKADGEVVVQVGQGEDKGKLLLTKPNEVTKYAAYTLRQAPADISKEFPFISFQIDNTYFKTPFTKHKMDHMVDKKGIIVRIPRNLVNNGYAFKDAGEE